MDTQTTNTDPKADDRPKEKESNKPSRFVNIMKLMGMKGRLNLEHKRNEWHLPDLNTGILRWREMDSSESEELFAKIWQDHDWNVSQNDGRKLLRYVCAQSKVRPTKEYLQACKVDPELTDITLTNWLSPWLDNPDDDLSKWVSKAMLIQIVARVMEDSKPQRIIVTLRGPGNSGKTTLVQSLFPSDLDVIGDLNVGGSDRDILAQLTNAYVLEFNELVGMNRKDAASLKSLLGAGYKQMRRLYSDTASKRTYTAAIIGTTNLDPVLYDDEALISRFVFVDFHRSEIDPAIRIPEIRDHLFALALRAYRKDRFESSILPQHLKVRQYEQAELSVNSDQSLNDIFAELDWSQIPSRFRILDMAGYMGLARDMNQYRQFKLHATLPKFLRSKGFVVKKGASYSEWWQRPPTDLSGQYPLPDDDPPLNATAERRERATIGYDKQSVSNHALFHSARKRRKRREK